MHVLEVINFIAFMHANRGANKLNSASIHWKTLHGQLPTTIHDLAAQVLDPVPGAKLLSYSLIVRSYYY